MSGSIAYQCEWIQGEIGYVYYSLEMNLMSLPCHAPKFIAGIMY